LSGRGMNGHRERTEEEAGKAEEETGHGVSG
jgi:hypothetical protein